MVVFLKGVSKILLFPERPDEAAHFFDIRLFRVYILLLDGPSIEMEGFPGIVRQAGGPEYIFPGDPLNHSLGPKNPHMAHVGAGQDIDHQVADGPTPEAEKDLINIVNIHLQISDPVLHAGNTRDPPKGPNQPGELKGNLR